MNFKTEYLFTPYCLCAYLAATATVLNMQKPIGTEHSAWWPGGLQTWNMNTSTYETYPINNNTWENGIVSYNIFYLKNRLNNIYYITIWEIFFKRNCICIFQKALKMNIDIFKKQNNIFIKKDKTDFEFFFIKNLNFLPYYSNTVSCLKQWINDKFQPSYSHPSI